MGKKENCIVLVTHSAGDSLFPAATVSTEGHIQPSPAHDTHWVKKTQQKRKTKPSLVWNKEKGDLLSGLPLCDSREGQLLPISARPCWNFRFCIGNFSWQISDSDWAWISSKKTCSQHTPGMGFSESDRKHNMGCCCLFRIYFYFKCKKFGGDFLIQASNSIFPHIIALCMRSNPGDWKLHLYSRQARNEKVLSGTSGAKGCYYKECPHGQFYTCLTQQSHLMKWAGPVALCYVLEIAADIFLRGAHWINGLSARKEKGRVRMHHSEQIIRLTITQVLWVCKRRVRRTEQHKVPVSVQCLSTALNT